MGQSKVTTVVLGDIHFPFHHAGAIQWALNLVKTLKPKYVVQVGDLYDLYSFSKYPRSHNVMAPADELCLARELAESMWAKLVKTGAECFQLYGNHDDRIAKRIYERFPEAETLILPAVHKLYAFPNVGILNSSADVLELGGVLFQHGNTQDGQHARWNNQSTVVGHRHVGGVRYFQNKQGTYWELNAGWLGNIKQPVFNYKVQNRIHGTTLGVGIIDQLGPRFVPYPGR